MITQALDQEQPAAEAEEATASRPQMDVRVNLLPKTIAERVRARQARTVAITLVAASATICGGLWFMAQQSVSAAQAQVDNAQAQQRVLQKEVVKYADVPRIFGAVERAQGELATAMGKDVRWSYVLNDLSLITPRGVALSNMSVTLAEGEPAPVANGKGATEAAEVAMPIAKVQWNGEATSFNGIAAWLDALSKLPTYGNPYFSQSAKQGQTNTVTFQSSADVNPSALSHRFDRKVQK